MRLPTLLLAAAALWSVSFAGRAQVCSSINNEVVSVDVRNDEWTAAKIKANPGDLIIVRAGGLVKIAHTLLGEVGPRGAPNGSGRLDMKIGAKTVVPIADRWVGALREPGAFQFRVNAERYKDNSGAYRVNVIVIPAGALPAAVKVDEE